MSELSETNTIQKIPIPHHRSDVEAFLDDIFDRALDNNNNNSKGKGKLSNSSSNTAAAASHLQKRIKGGYNFSSHSNNLNLEEIFSNNFILNRPQYSNQDHSRSDIDELWNEHEEDQDYYQSLDETSFSADSLEPNLPDKEYEFAKILKTFLINKPYLSKLNRTTHQHSFFDNNSSSKNEYATKASANWSFLVKTTNSLQAVSTLNDCSSMGIYTDLNECTSQSISSTSSSSSSYFNSSANSNYCSTSNFTDTFSLGEEDEEEVEENSKASFKTTTKTTTNTNTTNKTNGFKRIIRNLSSRIKGKYLRFLYESVSFFCLLQAEKKLGRGTLLSTIYIAFKNE